MRNLGQSTGLTFSTTFLRSLFFSFHFVFPVKEQRREIELYRKPRHCAQTGVCQLSCSLMTKSCLFQRQADDYQVYNLETKAHHQWCRSHSVIDGACTIHTDQRINNSTLRCEIVIHGKDLGETKAMSISLKSLEKNFPSKHRVRVLIKTEGAHIKGTGWKQMVPSTTAVKSYEVLI